MGAFLDPKTPTKGLVRLSRILPSLVGYRTGGFWLSILPFLISGLLAKEKKNIKKTLKEKKTTGIVRSVHIAAYSLVSEIQLLDTIFRITFFSLRIYVCSESDHSRCSAIREMSL